MRWLVLPLMLAAAPALAADPIVLMLENRGPAIESLAIFPLGDQGEVIEDILMSRDESIAQGATVALDTHLSSDHCGKVSVWGRLTGGREITAVVDLCRSNRLIVE